MRKYTYRFSKYGEMRDRLAEQTILSRNTKYINFANSKRKPIYKLRAADEIIYK